MRKPKLTTTNKELSGKKRQGEKQTGVTAPDRAINYDNLYYSLSKNSAPMSDPQKLRYFKRIWHTSNHTFEESEQRR